MLLPKKVTASAIAVLMGTAGLFVSFGPAAANTPEIVFPIAEEDVADFTWSNTYGAPRSGGRSHLGVDLLGPKMGKIVAVENGEITNSDYDNVGNWLEIVGDSGIRYRYIHLNNDTPGTDDASASCTQVFSARLCGVLNGTEIVRGTRVSAGEHIAFNGDSGNAEATAPHLHFEIALPNSAGGYTSIDPTPAVIAAFALLQAGSVTYDQIVNSDEAKIVRLYWSFFLRNPELQGFEYWLDQFNNGASLETIAYSFAAGAEFDILFAGFSDAQYVEALYGKVLNRGSDTSGKAYWIGELEAGRLDRSTMVVYFAEGVEMKTQLRDRTEAIAFYYTSEGRIPSATEIKNYE